MSLHLRLNLPPFRPFQAPSWSAQYGAYYEAARYCGFAFPPATPRGVWQHGWRGSYQQDHPGCVINDNQPFDAERRYWVARKDEEAYLRRNGLPRTRAIGLPIVYVTAARTERKPGSLLVMPAHSLKTTEHVWDVDEYAEQIARVAGHFSEIVVCIHYAGLDKGMGEPFRKRGFELVEGARANDAHALRRMATLFSAFEYVTTNSWGSALPYAAYFGAKASVYGAYPRRGMGDYKNHPVHELRTGALALTLENISEEALRAHYPWLFQEPQEAVERRDWGRFEVGESERLSPRELRELFEWDTPGKRITATALRALENAATRGVDPAATGGNRVHRAHKPTLMHRLQTTLDDAQLARPRKLLRAGYLSLALVLPERRMRAVEPWLQRARRWLSRVES